MDRTQTAETLAPTRAALTPCPVLRIVAHPDPRFVGRMAGIDHNPIVIGRGRSVFGAGALEVRSLSRMHCEVLGGARPVVRDLGSRNGTVVNGHRVTSAQLALGDVVVTGPIVFLVHPHLPGQAPIADPHIVGESLALRGTLERVERVAPHDTTTLLLGETGAGKEVVAQAIHRRSGRAGRFVALNCGAMPEQMLLSELFGHRRGAFSGADAQRPGLVAAAQGGTLFLDEIGDAGPALQVALLRLLQERTFRPVGADLDVPSTARVVAATHQDMAEQVASGAFREDLWMRLSRWIIKVPPLRERREDIPTLFNTFVSRYAGRPIPPTPRLTLALMRAPWRGNVRELDAVAERLVIEQGHLELLDLSEDLALSLAPEAPPPPAFDGRPSPTQLASLFKAHGGRVTGVAETLGVARNTLYRWLADAGLDLTELRTVH